MPYASRPPQIDRILKAMDDNNIHQMRVELETYIADLETQQQPVPLLETRVSVVNLMSNEPPIWSHQRVMEADARRRTRALSKRNNYQ